MEDIHHVKQVLTLLQMAGVTLKLERFRFLTNTINYFGHIFLQRRLEFSLHATDAIKQLKESRNVTKLRPLLGL